MHSPFQVTIISKKGKLLLGGVHEHTSNQPSLELAVDFARAIIDNNQDSIAAVSIVDLREELRPNSVFKEKSDAPIRSKRK